MRKIIILSLITLLGCGVEPETKWICGCNQIEQIKTNLNKINREINHTTLTDEEQRDTILCLYQEQVMKNCKLKPLVSLDSCEQVMYNM